MPECDICKKIQAQVTSFHPKEDETIWVCHKCVKNSTRELGFIHKFEPFDLFDGPIHERIPHNDPNFIEDKYSGGFRSGVHIETKADRDKYYKMLGIREAETGDSFQGVRMELKTKPSPKVFSFPKSLR